MNKMILRMIKVALAATLSVSMVFGYSVPAEAARMEYPDGTVFDEVYYYVNNPDVAASCGHNRFALYDHYKTTGQAEGRFGADPNGTYYYWYTLFPDQTTTLFAKVDGVLAQITNPGMSDREKIAVVKNWMCDHITYDRDYMNNNFRNGRDTDAETVFDDGIGVCEGYAKLFQVFMYRAGINCLVVNGFAGGDKHAWNDVMLDGHWYEIDVTWIDSGGYGISGTENLSDDDLRDRINAMVDRLNEQHDAQYYLVDKNVGMQFHTPAECVAFYLCSDLGELLNDIGG